MELTLEKELVARVFLHKVAIVRSAIINTYIAREIKKGGIVISLPCIEQEAMDFSDRIISNILSEGALDEVYEKAWEVMEDHIPDDFSIM